ncbi:hypothetical protein [Neotamlana laminarinivorans]|uniref:Uncharacterized protein n=1 Tax=Neotamlana laminarinivorans TaxID=2883124 RepID=A0A9X1HWW9_9FLAO|nr:hypothetical protein [Tamlana laminarinivorans]MCB4797395.1 hypothetical protein [Tamlana laminarinivorans]
MENPFKKVIHNEKLPDIIKERVMNDIDIVKLALDFTDLMVIKYPDAVADFLKNNDEDDFNEDKKQIN